MNKSEKFWNRTAYKYNKREKEEESTYAEYIDKIKKHLRKTDTVLDFGCGTGLISIGLSNGVKKIIAIDTSSALIEISKNNAAERNVKNIEYSCSTLFDNKYSDGSFDVILVLYIYHLLEDLPGIMKRLNRLLVPNGTIISATPCMGEKNKILSKILMLGSLFGIVPKINAFKISKLKDEFTKANFEIIETELIDKVGQQYFIVARKK